MEGLLSLALNCWQWLARVSWQVSVLIVLVLLVQWVFRRGMSPGWRHALWLLVVARLLLPSSLESRLSLFNWVRLGLPSSGSNPPRLAAPVSLTAPALQTVSGSGLTAPPQPGAAASDVQSKPWRPKAELVLAVSGLPVEPTTGWLTDPRKPMLWLTAVWLAGVLLLSARVLAETIRLRRSIVPRRLVTETAVLELLEDCKQLMKVQAPIVLVQTDRVSTPVLYGFVRPRLLMPVGLLENFSRTELRFVFLHELAHIQRHDIALSWLMAGLQVLHWFNPLVWFAFARMKADRELACDAMVLSRTEAGQQMAYGRTMLRLLESFVRTTSLPPFAGILEDSSQLQTRIRCIASFDRRSPSPALAAGLVLVLGLAALTDQRVQGRAWSASNLPAQFVTVRPEGGADIRLVTLRPEADIDLGAALTRGGLLLAAMSESTNLLQQGYKRISAVDGLGVDRWQRCSNEGAPSPRTAHSVVWTGRELLVWGGGARDVFKRTGARYNPATDVWRPMSTNCPLAGRWHQAAVWTGKEMLVWGGRSNFFATNHLGDGARYEPETDTWKLMSSQGAPAARSQMAAVWTGHELIVWGGRGDDVAGFNDGARYNPETDKWTHIECRELEGRHAPTAIWTGVEMIVWGGFSREPQAAQTYDTGAQYDPVRDQWSLLPREGVPRARYRHTAVWTGTEMIVWGGVNYPSAEFLGDGARFDPALGRWSPLSLRGAPEKRGAHLGVWTGSEMVVWGGFVKGDECLNTGGRYDLRADRWAPLTVESAPAPRFLMRPDSGIWTGEQLLVFGGYDLNTEFGSSHRWMPPQAMHLYQH